MPAQPLRKVSATPAVFPAADRSSFLNHVTVEHGPAPLLGRFFLAADTAAREVGVTVSFATPEDLLAANEANRETWKPLLSVFDPRYVNLTPENALILVGRDAAGEVVATQAARLLRLDNASMYDEMVNLRLSYDNPARDKRPGESFNVLSEEPRAIRGRTLFGGAVWYRTDFRKRGLAAILPRISRAYAFTRWNTEYTTSMMATGIVKGGVAAASGYTNIGPELQIRNSTLGDLNTVFMWMRAPELLVDLERWLAAAGAQVDSAVAERRA